MDNKVSNQTENNTMNDITKNNNPPVSQLSPINKHIKTIDSETDLSVLVDTLSVTGMQEKDVLEMHSMQEFYSLIYRRVKLKKQIYQAASNRYKIFDLVLFTIPLLLLQIANAILPPILTTNNDTPSEEAQNRAKLSATLTTVLSSISAAWIAMLGKLKWGEKSQKYENVANTYALLTSQTYFKLTQVKVVAETLAKDDIHKEMMHYLKYTQELEQNARKNCPLPPRSIERKVTADEKRTSSDV